ncbi:N-acetylmuramoyl-L-alanine amidase [Paenibacillus phyllosphaerae]|uniref:N-acetylmuramoyl-L-alanine amidase n=1 Tax=Paenibacillus phyllosphaerae TaxID=274593 RepID=A0A7W5FNF4_9BACL|nr:cell wall hydrolase [Paenibacillus phyllosphaerae]MBB3111265.1 N-acetylmuramoyl-L-alanine amidase [Paenibacillus phyllosphaerae]
MNMLKRTIAMLMLGMMITTAVTVDRQAQAASPATLKLGMVSQDVPDLQYRLQLLGYYPVTIGTKFTISTQVAVRHFQRDYGLPVDGLVGASTWATLKKYTVSKPELAKIARTVYGEARGESYLGQVAVGAVIMNRLASPLFPNTVTDVIMEPYAFTAVADGQYWLIPDQTAFQAARQAVRGYDPTKNALFYYNPKTATSTFMNDRAVTTVIGAHVFTK